MSNASFLTIIDMVYIILLLLFDLTLLINQTCVSDVLAYVTQHVFVFVAWLGTYIKM